MFSMALIEEVRKEGERREKREERREKREERREKRREKGEEKDQIVCCNQCNQVKHGQICQSSCKRKRKGEQKK